MYDVHSEPAPEEFSRCWRAAGRHLQNCAQGGLQSWLRAHLNPPFLEHLSFRLGNQLFFVRLEDVDGDLDMPGTMEGLQAVAEGCRGHACLMPMRRSGHEWGPSESGWGLIDARTRRAVNPPALISDENIVMTDWELQDFAVQVVRDYLQKEGKQLMSWNGDPRVNPSLWFVGEHGPEWVVVRTVRYPERAAPRPANLPQIKEQLARASHRGHFASVALVSAEERFDRDPTNGATVTPLFRGHGMYVNFAGLEGV